MGEYRSSISFFSTPIIKGPVTHGIILIAEKQEIVLHHVPQKSIRMSVGEIHHHAEIIHGDYHASCVWAVASENHIDSIYNFFINININTKTIKNIVPK